LPAWSIPLLVEAPPADSTVASVPDAVLPVERPATFPAALPSRASSEAPPVVPEEPSLQTEVASAVVGIEPETSLTASVSPTWSWSTWFLLVWVMGAALALLPVLAGLAGVCWMARRARLVQEDSWLDL